MFLVDSHCHLDQLDPASHNGDVSKALALAKGQGVQHFLCVCITLNDFQNMMDIVRA
jgi:TatD DNase family protein